MDTYFYFYNHANQNHENQFSGDCSCSCFTCFYKLDLIFLLILLYLLLMDKITINIHSAEGSPGVTGVLPLVPEDESGVSSSPSRTSEDEKLDDDPNSLPESVNSTSSTSTGSTATSSGRKLIKPDISLDFLDLSDDEEIDEDEDNGNGKDGHEEKITENGESGDFFQDTFCVEELFSNGFVTSTRLKPKSSLPVKRQSSVDSDSFSWDSSSISSTTSSLSCPIVQQQQVYSSLPCNLIDNICVHEGLEVDLPFNLSLTFTELGHIRKALAREELDSMSFCHSVRDQLIRGKLCSTCLKTRFKLFGPWADCCRLCERPVCSRCSSNVQINAKRYNSIPIQLLVPNKRYHRSSFISPNSSVSPTNSSTLAKMKTTCQKRPSSLSFTSSSASSISSSPSPSPSSTSSTGLSRSSPNRPNQWNQSKGSFSRSFSWLRKNVPKDSVQKVNEDGQDEEDEEDQKDTKLSTMVIKLCLDCELFFVTLLAI